MSETNADPDADANAGAQLDSSTSLEADPGDDTNPRDDTSPGSPVDQILASLAGHASCRSYQADEVPRTAIERIVGMAQRAATSSNLQMWTALVVRDHDRRDRIAHLCGDQQHIREAPVFIAWCADRSRLDRVSRSTGYRQDTEYLESFLVAAVDTAIAMQNAVVAAEAMGYGTCYIGGLRNDTAAVIDLLDLPPFVFPIAGMTIGVPAGRRRTRPRLDLSAVLQWERYTADPEWVFRSYDQTMRETGIYRDRQVGGVRADGSPAQPLPEAEYGWMEHSARRVSSPSRVGLSEVVRSQGYRLR